MLMTDVKKRLSAVSALIFRASKPGRVFLRDDRIMHAAGGDRQGCGRATG